MSDRKPFFDSVRKSLFRGKLSKKQVEGMNFILDQWNETGFTDFRWLAYALATAYHETARTMQPIREYGRGRGRKYGRPDPVTGETYYGRGYVQLTWKDNYAKAGRVMGIDFVRNPDLVMEPENAAFLMFQGMHEGWFRGRKGGSRKKFSDYINEHKCDYIWARDIINGIPKGKKLPDKAQAIAGYARKFEAAINAVIGGLEPSEPTPAPETPKPTPEQPQGLLARIIDAIMRIIFK